MEQTGKASRSWDDKQDARLSSISNSMRRLHNWSVYVQAERNISSLSDEVYSAAHSWNALYALLRSNLPEDRNAIVGKKRATLNKGVSDWGVSLWAHSLKVAAEGMLGMNWDMDRVDRVMRQADKDSDKFLDRVDGDGARIAQKIRGIKNGAKKWSEGMHRQLQAERDAGACISSQKQ